MDMDFGSVRLKINEAVLKKYAVKQATTVVKKVGEEIKKEAIRSIRKDKKTGKWYTGRSGRYYQASATPEAPAVDTGSLYKSISVLMAKEGNDTVAYVGTMDPTKRHSMYVPGVALALEKGLGRINGQPRPFLRPALAKTVNQLDKIMKQGKK